MNSALQRERALAFHKLHQGGSILVLPNAWDCPSATLFEQAGFPAVATTSGGIASVFGYPDGQKIPYQLMLGMVGRIAAVVSVPTTADLEAGYWTKPEDVAETIAKAIEAGLVGCNLEDGTGAPEQPLKAIERQVEILKAARQAAGLLNMPFFINARTDVFLHGTGDSASRVSEAIRRATAYRAAGADGVFVINVKDSTVIRELARQIPPPINILVGPGSPSISELQDLGVARVTFGSGLMRAVFPRLRDIAQELRQQNNCSALSQTEFSHTFLNELFQAKLATNDPVGPWIGQTDFSFANVHSIVGTFTPRAEQALDLARQEATRLCHNFVGTEHVLLGLIALDRGIATNVLLKQGLSLEDVRKKIELHIPAVPEQKVIGNAPYTPTARRMLSLAANEAKTLNHTYIGTEHLLLGLLSDQEGVAGKILRELGVGTDRTREEILRELDPNFGA